MRFDYERARAALANNPVAAAFLEKNKDALAKLTEQAILAMVNAYLDGLDEQVVTTFYTLDQQAEAIVEGTADIARRRLEFKQRALAAARIVAQLIISVLAAGVVL